MKIYTVGEVIEHLQKFPKEKHVVIISGDRRSFQEPVVWEQLIVKLGQTDADCPILRSEDVEVLTKTP